MNVIKEIKDAIRESKTKTNCGKGWGYLKGARENRSAHLITKAPPPTSQEIIGMPINNETNLQNLDISEPER